MANNLCTEGVKGHIGVVAEKRMGSILEGLKCPARKPPKGLSWGLTLWALCFSNVTQQLADGRKRSRWVWGDVSRSWAGVIERDEEAQAGARPGDRLEETGSCREEVLVSPR